MEAWKRGDRDWGKLRELVVSRVEEALKKRECVWCRKSFETIPALLAHIRDEHTKS